MMSKININFFTPYDAQIPIVESCIGSSYKYIIYNAARQSGKSMMACNMAVYWALQERESCIMFVSPTDSQVKKQYRQILNSIIGMPFVKSYKIQAGDSEIQFNNLSVILFRSAASTNSLRGYSLTHLIGDEAAFIDEATFQTILSPSLAVRGKKILLCSTPRGTNFFYKQYTEGQKEGLYKSFKTTYEDNPYADKEFIEEQRKVLPSDIFQQEYEGCFIDAGGLFKNVSTYATTTNILEPVPGDTYFSGIDIGFKKDFTVHSIFNQKGEMIHMDRFTNVENDRLIQRIIDTLNKFNVAKCLVESNNQGLPVIQQLISRGMWKVEAFNTTATSKPQLINEFIYAFNSGEIKLLKNPELIEEFKAFSYELSKGGHVKFRASYGFDDIVMSVAIAYSCLKNNRYAGQFIFS